MTELRRVASSARANWQLRPSSKSATRNLYERMDGVAPAMLPNDRRSVRPRTPLLGGSWYGPRHRVNVCP